MAAAVETNTAEFYLSLGRAAGAEERDDAEIHWVIDSSPIPAHNCVVRADLPEHAVDAAIAASRVRMAAQEVAGAWHVGPSMRPATIGERLQAQGFTYRGDQIGMAVDLHQIPDAVPAPEGLVLERIRDDRQLEIWTQTVVQGFEGGERETGWLRDMYRRIGLGDDAPWRHYLGLLEGQPVATASLFSGSGSAGLYLISTAPAARRQGIGAAMTLGCLHHARSLGYRTGVLQASAAGYEVYRRLGFQEYCRIGYYEWAPHTPSE